MSATKGPQITSANDLSRVNSASSELSAISVVFTQSEIRALRGSWSSMKEDPSALEKSSVQGTASAFFCQQFYDNLLGEFPELMVLFPSLKAQASAMAGILSLVISQLENLHRVADILSSLGKRHSRIIGVEVVHYELVGNALLKTLQDRCDDDFTLELENAWIKLYSYIANLMLQAGEDPPLAVAQQQASFPDLTATVSGSSSVDNSSISGSSYSNSTTAPTVSHAQSSTTAATSLTGPPTKRNVTASSATYNASQNASPANGHGSKGEGKFNLKANGKRNRRVGKKDGQDCTIM